MILNFVSRYYELKNKVRGTKKYCNTKIKRSKGKILRGKCKNIEIQMRTGSMDAAYKSVTKFFADYKSKKGSIEDNNGIIIYEDKQREHMEGLSRSAI